ncbi:MAG TPA: hypothetical protein DCO79_17110 [Spirochaeta sp.]|nr:hypothetical protein [Spirochaeta sp.]
MKKSILLILLILVLSASVFGVDRVDMIVLLDNSVSVLPFYDNIQNSLIKRIISEHLKPGDTFSLITFADYPEVEISREIKNDKDINEILAYSAILQPMGNHTDLILALRFLYKYTLDLPLSNRKKIVILTDGIHDPPSDSPYYNSDPNVVKAEIEKAAGDIHREGWDVSIVELEDAPGTDGVLSTADSDEEADDPAVIDVIDTVAETLGSKPNAFKNDGTDMAGIALGIPLVGIPEHLGETRGELTVPLSIRNRGNEVMLFSLSAVNAEGSDILKEKVSIKLEPDSEGVLNVKLNIAADSEPGEYSKDIGLKLVGGLNTEPRTLKINYTFIEKGGFDRAIDMLLDWRVIAVLIAVIVAVIIIILVKRASSGDGEFINPLPYKDEEEEKTGTARETEKETSTAVPAGQETSKKREPEEYLIAAMSSETEDEIPHKKHRPVQMLVYGQNTKLGITNVKWLGLNRKRSIGSSSYSIFKIFFIKVPSVIADIECTGDDFIFTPVRNEYFPDVEEPIHYCLNKKIKIVNTDNKMFYIEFRQWVSELEKLNRLMAMTKHSGKPDMEF